MTDKKVKNSAKMVLEELKMLANPEKAEVPAKFLQVQKGGYGENDHSFISTK